MADERIGLQLDLGPAAASAKELGAALQTTKVDATAFGAALQSIDEIRLTAETAALERALDQLVPSEAKATRATTDFSAALDKLIADEAQAEAETKRLADEALAQLAAAEAKATTEAHRLANAGMDSITVAAIEATQAQKAMNAVLAEGTTRISTTHVGAVRLGESTRNLGNLAQNASYAFQDFTSQLGTRGLAGGLAAVQNNIPSMVRDLGQSAGLAGAVSAVAVAAGLLYENWDKVVALFQDSTLADHVAKMKELAEATKAATDANVKLATSVKGDDETQRAAAFKKALQAYGGGEKLLNEEGGQDPGHRSVVADAIAKALKGSETDIGFLKGGSQGLATAMAQPAIEADEKENERRVAARQKRREDAAREAEKADKEAEAAQQKADDDFAKAKDKLLKGLDKVIDVGAKALEPDPEGDARRADIARRSGLGRDFKDFANDRGFTPLKSDVATAARMMQSDMSDGASEEQAMTNALQALIAHVAKQTEISNRRAMQARQFQAQVNNLPSLNDEGNW